VARRARGGRALRWFGFGSLGARARVGGPRPAWPLPPPPPLRCAAWPTRVNGGTHRVGGGDQAAGGGVCHVGPTPRRAG